MELLESGDAVEKAASHTLRVDGFSIGVVTADGDKCERCWNYDASTGSADDFPGVCIRCAKSLRSMGWTLGTLPPKPTAKPAAEAKPAAAPAPAAAGGVELEALKQHVAAVAGVSPGFAGWLAGQEWRGAVPPAPAAAAPPPPAAAGGDVPDDVEAAVAAQGAKVRRLKEEEGLTKKDPRLAEAVAELLRLKALLPA